MKTHNSFYATSIHATREGEIYPIPELFCRGVRVKERGTPRRVHKGGTHGHVQAVVGSSITRRASNRRVGILPMRNDSRHGTASQGESANSCIYNIHHTAPVDEKPPLAKTFCGKVYRTHWRCLQAQDLSRLSPPLVREHRAGIPMLPPFDNTREFARVHTG